MVAASPDTAATVRDRAAVGGPLAALWTAVLEASEHTRGGLQTLADYLLSLLNLALGFLIIWIRPRNWTARLLGVGLIGTAAAFNLESHALFHTVLDVPPLAFVNGLHMSLHAVSGAAFLHAILAFPDGRLATSRERLLVSAVWVIVAVESVIGLVTGVGPLALVAMVPIDLALSDAIADVAAVSLADALFYIVFFAMLVPAVGAVAQVRRYRTVTDPEEAQRSRVLVWALVLAFGVGLVFTVVTTGVAILRPDPLAFIQQVEGVMFRLFAPLFALIPIAIIVGVLRYRLWDVDIVVNRTLVYATLTGALAIAYVVAVTGFGLVLTPATDRVAGDLVPILATATVALLFLPLRRRIQVVIDRRLYRRRYDAVRAVDDLADRLRTEADLEAVCGDVLETIDATVQPEHAAVWLDPEPTG